MDSFPRSSTGKTGHIQIDDPTFCYFCNDAMVSAMERAGVDHEALLDTYIRAINVVTQGRPDDLTMSIHMCRGNYKVHNWLNYAFLFTFTDVSLAPQGGVHFTEGGYGRISIKLFNTLDVDVFYVSFYCFTYPRAWGLLCVCVLDSLNMIPTVQGISNPWSICLLTRWSYLDWSRPRIQRWGSIFARCF